MLTFFVFFSFSSRFFLSRLLRLVSAFICQSVVFTPATGSLGECCFVIFNGEHQTNFLVLVGIDGTVSKCSDILALTCSPTTGLSLTCPMYYSIQSGVCTAMLFARYTGYSALGNDISTTANPTLGQIASITSPSACWTACKSTAFYNLGFTGISFNSTAATCNCKTGSSATLSKTLAINKMDIAVILGTCASNIATAPLGATSCQSITYASLAWLVTPFLLHNNADLTDVLELS